MYSIDDSDIQEQNVSQIEQNLTPAERVQEAVRCLPASLESTLTDSASHFKRWTIQDFTSAYRSGETTPLKVYCLIIVYHSVILILVIPLNINILPCICR